MEETKLMKSGKKPTNLTQESLVEFPEIMIRSEAAKFLRMSDRHLRWLVSEGRIPEIKGGRRNDFTGSLF